jgi:thymidine kinase
MSQFNNDHSLVLGKLYFRHGPVSSAKTMNLLAVAYNYRLQGKKVLLLKVSPS